MFDAVLSVAGKPLEYRWGTEVPTEEALSDADYLAGLRGLSVLYQHPEDGLISGSAPRDGDGRRIGTVLDARYEADSGEVVVELAIPENADQEAIRQGLREVSEGYIPELEERDGQTYQVRRRPNHVAVTERGRAQGARIRVDREDAMDPEEIKKILEAMALQIGDMHAGIKSLVEYNDACKAKMDEDMGGETKVIEAVVSEMGEECRSDAAAFKSRLDARVRDEVRSIVSLHLRADALGVVVPETAETASQVRRELALALGADASRVDSADYCDGVIAAAKVTTSPAGRVDSTHNHFPV